MELPVPTFPQCSDGVTDWSPTQGFHLPFATPRTVGPLTQNLFAVFDLFSQMPQMSSWSPCYSGLFLHLPAALALGKGERNAGGFW